MTFARESVSWDIEFEDMVLVAFYIENSSCSAFLGERLPSRDAADLKLYFSLNTYYTVNSLRAREVFLQRQRLSQVS